MINCWKNEILVGLIIALSVPGLVSAAEEQEKLLGFDVAVGIEGMIGDTTYQTGGNIGFADGSTLSVHFPVSELEWPLDFFLGRIDAGLEIGSSWRINGTVKKHISDPDVNMIYKDWITLSNPGQLDIYSNSSISDFDAIILDVDVEWVFLNRETWSLFAGIGYQYQGIEYEGTPIHQYSPSGLPGMERYGDGSVGITYEVSHVMPYILVGGDIAVSDSFSFAGSFAYSPWVNTEDEVTYIYQNLTGTGDMDGKAFMVDVYGQYNINSSLNLEAGLSYTVIDVDGTMSTALNSGVETIDEESETSQTSAYFKVGYTF